MKKLFKVLKVVKNVVCWGLIVVLVGVLVSFLVSRFSGNAPGLFGYSLYRISTGSMEPELMVGDVILDKVVQTPEEIKVGDVVTYDGTGELSGMTITHKVVVAPYKNELGEWILQTQGVANPTPDKEFSFDRVRAVYVCSLPFVTFVVGLFMSPWGLVVFILLVLLIFFDELVNIVRVLTGHEKTAKDAENINEIIERLTQENKESKEKDDV